MAKRYWEVTVNQFPTGTLIQTDGLAIGVASSATTGGGAVYILGFNSSDASYSQVAPNLGRVAVIINSAADFTLMPPFGAGDTLCFALDDVANLWWARNGASGQWNNSGTADPATGTGGVSLTGIGSGGPYYIGVTMSVSVGTGEVTMNAGASAFVGTPPAGYSAFDNTGNTIWNNGFNSGLFTFSNADLTIEAQNVEGATMISGPAIIGQILTVVQGCAQVRITGSDGMGNYTGVVIYGSLPTVPNDPFGTPLPLAPGDWEIGNATNTVGGLDYLDGMEVTGTYDGQVIPLTTVVAGNITLPAAASQIIVGLPYVSQLQTLKLDTGDPTIQGRRKNIPAVTVRVECTSGLTAGPDFSDLRTLPGSPGGNNSLVPAATGPANFVTDDVRVIVQPDWKVDGQLAFEQDLPLPVTILGVIPEVIVGDTQR